MPDNAYLGIAMEMQMTVQEQLEKLEARLLRLEDETAIRRLMAEMVRAADQRDREPWGDRMVEFYTDDGQWKSVTGFADVGMSERGRAALVKHFTRGTRICQSAHHLGSESIDVRGDEASGTWLCFEPATLKAANATREAVWLMGRFICEFRREKTGWKVRTVEFEGIFCTPYDQGWVKEPFTSVLPLPAEAG